MGLISPTQVVDATTMDAVDVNGPVNTIANEINGNLDNANIKAAAGIATSKLARDSGITADMIGPQAIYLGYAQITSTFSTSSTTDTQVTGLTVSTTILSTGRRVKITAFASNMYSTTTAGFNRFTIWEGAVGTGVQLGRCQNNLSNLTGQSPAVAYAVFTPSSTGVKTYNIGLAATAGTANIEAAAGYPAFILVELV